MGFTTCLGLHSQTTRLCESVSWSDGFRADGVLTLSDVPFQGTWARSDAEARFYRLQFDRRGDRFSSWALPGSLAATRGILVSFFSSAY